MNNYEIDKLIKVETLPKIFYELEQIGKDIEVKLENIKNMPCTDDTKQEIKKTRTDINKTLEMFETRRKQVKQQCLNEYNQFEQKYNEEIKSKLDNASEQLKQQIDKIEEIQILEKQNEVENFINEYIMANYLKDIISIQNVIDYGGLKINLSTSVKLLKEQAIAFIEKVVSDIKLIDMEEYSSEILYEYQICDFDFVKAKTNIVERHKMIEQYTKQQEQVQEVVKQEEKQEQVVQEILQPKEIIEEDEILECSFTIKTTKENLIKIKNYLKELGIEYE